SNAYKISWDRINKTGNEYLKTIVYTPDDTAYTFKPISSEFKTVGNTALKGIITQQQRMDSIEQVMNLLSNEYLCLVDYGTEAGFWWNSNKVYDWPIRTQPDKSINNYDAGLSYTDGMDLWTCIEVPNLE
ncbi:MAG: hypothetical protein ABH821_06080, partial [archaeon]